MKTTKESFGLEDSLNKINMKEYNMNHWATGPKRREKSWKFYREQLKLEMTIDKQQMTLRDIATISFSAEKIDTR